MIVRDLTEIEALSVDVAGAKGVTKRVLISEVDGAPNFIMRQFSIRPGGNTPYHTHDWEHVIYVLSGAGQVKHSEGVHNLKAGGSALVLPNEEHGFVNTGDKPLVFLCSIPK